MEYAFEILKATDYLWSAPQGYVASRVLWSQSHGRVLLCVKGSVRPALDGARTGPEGMGHYISG